MNPRRKFEDRFFIIRSFISLAALLVKVIIKIDDGLTLLLVIRLITFDISTLVFPDPAPARITEGPLAFFTASNWCMLRFLKKVCGIDYNLNIQSIKYKVLRMK